MSKHVNDISNYFLCLDTKQGKRFGVSSGILRVLRYMAIFEKNMRNSTLNYLISDAHDDRHVDSAASAAEATCRRRAYYW